jgi:hypothetical protein
VHPKPPRANRIGLIGASLTALASACLLASVGCRADSSANRRSASELPGAEAHARDAALGSAATCLFRHRPIQLEQVRTECEHAGNDPSVRVHIEWATSDGWGARATKDGVRGDCVYIAGWPTESQYLLTSAERRGAIFGGSTCDGDTTTVPRSWPEFVQASFVLALARELRWARAYQTRHGGAFPPADSGHLHVDSLFQFRHLWARPESFAIEASSPALKGVNCLVWDGALLGPTPPTTARRRVARAGIVTCDDFRSASPVKS